MQQHGQHAAYAAQVLQLSSGLSDIDIFHNQRSVDKTHRRDVGHALPDINSVKLKVGNFIGVGRRVAKVGWIDVDAHQALDPGDNRLFKAIRVVDYINGGYGN